MKSPRDVAAKLFQDLAEQRWADAAQAVHEPDLVLWYRTTVGDRDIARRPITVEEFKRHDPDMPDAVAEYQVKRFNDARSDEAGRFGLMFATLTTRAALQAASPREAFADWLHAHDFDVQVRRHLDLLGPRAPRLQLQDLLGRRREVVGDVSDGRHAYVVYRIAAPGGPARSGDDDAHLLTLVNEDGNWQVRIRGDWWNGESGIVGFTELPIEADPPGSSSQGQE